MGSGPDAGDAATGTGGGGQGWLAAWDSASPSARELTRRGRAQPNRASHIGREPLPFTPRAC